MASYTRLIEFKVKDTELNRAVDKLSKTLDRIDKSLVGIDKKLDHIAKQGFGGVAKEANKAEKSVGKLGKSLKSIYSASGPPGIARMVSGGILGTVLGKKGDIAALITKLYAFDGALRVLSKGNTGLPAFNRRVTEAATALAGFTVAHAGALTGVVAGGAAILAGTKFFYDLGKGVRQAEANMIDFIKTSRQVGLGANLRSLFPKAAPGSRLGGADDGGPKIGLPPSSPIGVGSSRGLEVVRPKLIESQIAGVTKLNRELSRSREIQNNINASIKGPYRQAVVAVKQAQFASNVELLKAKTIQAAINVDIWAMQRAWQGVVGTIRGAKDLFGNLLGGKFGGAGQAAGVITLSRSIEFLTGKLGFLNNQWINNAKAASQWVTRVTEAVATVNIAYTGLTKVLGAASWTIGAIAGFKRWESEASATIWRLNRQVKAFSDGLNAMFMMMQGKGGTPGGVAQNLRDMVLGGEQRKENKRFAEQGPTNKQLIQKDLDLQIQKLNQRNTTEADYIKILQSKRQLERELRREAKKEQVMRVKSGEPFEEVFADKIADRDRRLKEARDKELAHEKVIRQARAKRAKFNKLALQNELKEIARKKKVELDAIEKVRQAELRATKDAANADKRRREQRGARRGRMGESLMLGAGFPLLFGGGFGSVAGGVTGAALSMGGKGFGAQILLSALGQQVDAFMGQMANVGQALNSVEKDATPLVERLGVAGTEFERQVKLLEKLGAEEEAFALAREKMIGLVGTKGVNDLAQFGKESQELSNAWKQFMTEVGAGLAGLVNAAGILRNLTEGLTGKSQLDRGIANEYNDAKLNDLNTFRERYGPGGDLRPGIRPEGLPSLTDISEQIKERQKILDQQRIDDEQEKVRLALNKASLLTLEEKKLVIEDTYRLGERGAEIEAKIRELKKDNKDFDEAAYRAKAQEIENLQASLDIYRKIGETIGDGLTSAIEGAIQGTKTLGQVATSVLNSIGRMLIQYGMTSLFGGMGGFGKWLSGTRAEGGPVTGNKSYIVGEKGPELFTPKSSGHITPNDELGGGGTSNITVNVDASGSSVEGDADQSAALGKMLGAAIQAELIKQRRPGGLLR